MTTAQLPEVNSVYGMALDVSAHFQPSSFKKPLFNLP